MNAFQSCRNTSDIVPLYLPQKLYLKPVVRINVTLQLPRRTVGKTISNWEVMEKIRSLIQPEDFTSLKVSKASLEFLRLEAEIDNKDKLKFVVERLNHKMIKLKEFSELMHLRACEAKLDFPTRHTWDSFFRESNDMDERKPGERPDTIHISNLPIKWFVHPYLVEKEDIKPSEKIFYKVFEKFGRIRHIDIPICDPYRKGMKSHMTGMQIFSFDENQFFEGYVQFKDYMGFVKTMDTFRNMKLLKKDSEECITINIKVDFDKTKHLSDASIRRREIVRDRLVLKMKEKEKREQVEKEETERQEKLEREQAEKERSEKEKRREEREQKRKQKILARLKISGADEISNKIAKEEKKLLQAQRKLEAIRLVEELFRRIKIKHEVTKFTKKGHNEGESELNRYKSTYEYEVKQQRDKLHKAIEGRVILKSILSGGPHLRSKSSDSFTSDSSAENEKLKKDEKLKASLAKNYRSLDAPYPYPDWMQFPNPYTVGSYYPQPLRVPPVQEFIPYSARGRGLGMRAIPGPSRGMSRRGRGYNFRNRGGGRRYNSYLLAQEEEYIKYFEKFLHDDRHRKDYSRSKTRSRSRRRSYSRSTRSRSRSYSKRKSRSRSYSKRRSRSDSRSRSHSRRRSRSYSNSRRKSRDSRSQSRNSRRRYKRSSISKSRRRSRSKSEQTRNKSRSRQRSTSRRLGKSNTPKQRSLSIPKMSQQKETCSNSKLSPVLDSNSRVKSVLDSRNSCSPLIRKRSSSVISTSSITKCSTSESLCRNAETEEKSIENNDTEIIAEEKTVTNAQNERSRSKSSSLPPQFENSKED